MRRTSGGVVFALLFVASLPAVTTRIYASDEAQYFAYLRSVWFDRDVSFENEYRYFDSHSLSRSAGFRETFLERTTETGKRVNFGTLGCALLWTPFYAIGHVVALIARKEAWPTDGFSPPYVVAVSYGSAIYGLLALLLSARIAIARLGRGWTAAIFAWIGTPLLFYMYVAPPMSHACSAFAVAAFIATWLRVRTRWSARGMCALGALAALMAMVREQDAFFVVGPALDFTRTLAARWRSGDAGVDSGEGSMRLIANGALGAAAAAIGYLPQAVAYLSLNGYPGPSQLVARKMTWSAPHALQVLFSPEHGFFWWTPLALVATLGLGRLAVAGDRLESRATGAPWDHADVRWIATCFLVMALLQVYVAGSVESWTVAGAFGQRRFVALTAVLTFGLAAVYPDRRPGRTIAVEAALVPGLKPRATAVTVVAWFVAILAVWWNVGLTLQFGAGLMDRQRLEPAKNAYVNFVVLPRMAPELVRRYVFERESYYRRGAPDTEP